MLAISPETAGASAEEFGFPRQTEAFLPDLDTRCKEVSFMARRVNCKTSVLRAIAPLTAALIVLIAVAALAQMPERSTAEPAAIPLSERNNFRAGPMDPTNPLFLAAVNYDSGGQQDFSIAAADLNGDGKPDLVVTDFCSDSNCMSGGVSVLLNKGRGTFQAPVVYVSGGFGARSVAIADVNSDGKPDLVVAGGGAVGVLLGNGDGTFQPVTTYSTDGGPYSVAVADVNGDGKLDVVVGYYCCWKLTHDGAVGVLLGNGDGTFRPVVKYDPKLPGHGL
jgi:hypothetical protein